MDNTSLYVKCHHHHHHHHQLNVYFLPRSIKGMDGCFPTASGNQLLATFWDLPFNQWRFHFEKIPFSHHIKGNCLSLGMLDRVFGGGMSFLTLTN
jgi:hypothetical protein